MLKFHHTSVSYSCYHLVMLDFLIFGNLVDLKWHLFKIHAVPEEVVYLLKNWPLELLSPEFLLSLAHFPLRCFFSYWFVGFKRLYIPDINIFSVIYIETMFSQYVTYILTLFIVPFIKMSNFIILLNWYFKILCLV